VFYQKYLRREFPSHTAFRYDQAINYFSIHLFQLPESYKTETHNKEYILWLYKKVIVMLFKRQFSKTWPSKWVPNKKRQCRCYVPSWSYVVA